MTHLNLLYLEKLLLHFDLWSNWRNTISITELQSFRVAHRQHFFFFLPLSEPGQLLPKHCLNFSYLKQLMPLSSNCLKTEDRMVNSVFKNSSCHMKCSLFSDTDTLPTFKIRLKLSFLTTVIGRAWLSVPESPFSHTAIVLDSHDASKYLIFTQSLCVYTQHCI